MDIVKIKIKKLNYAKYNPRQITEGELENLRNSIETFGLVEPIVINKDNTIIGGHQRVKALKSLGYKEAPCIIVELTKDKEKILNLALNKISGTWDENKLVSIIKDISKLPDIKKTGFSKEEINQFLVRHEIDFGEDHNNTDFSNNDEMAKIFERHERVEVPVEKPEIKQKKERVGFYCDNMEQWNKIKDHFKTTRKGQLDINKLMDLTK